MPSGIPLVRVAVLEPIAHLFSRHHLNLDSIVSKAGFAKIPKTPTDFYSYYDAVSILGLGARISGVQHMGLLLGKTGGLPSLGRYGDYIATAPTLYRAMLRATALIKWISPHLSLSLHREGSMVAWRATHPCERRDYHHGYFHTLTILVETVRRAAGPDWVPDEIRVGEKEFATATIQELLGAQVRHVEGEWSIVFPRRILIKPMSAWPEPGQDVTRESLAGTVIPEDFTSSLKVLMRSLLATRQANEEMFARVYGVSLRSFQRLLANNEGYRFRELLAKVRSEEARTLLSDEKLPLNDVARALGYTEQANFTRAFVRWVGVPPGEYRKLALSGEPMNGGASSAFGAE